MFGRRPTQLSEELSLLGMTRKRAGGLSSASGPQLGSSMTSAIDAATAAFSSQRSKRSGSF